MSAQLDVVGGGIVVFLNDKMEDNNSGNFPERNKRLAHRTTLSFSPFS